MKQTGKHRVIVINLLVALALTLIVNFSFLLNGNDVRGHRPPPMMTMAPGFIAFQLFYFYAMAIAIVMLNTVRSLSLTRKILLTIGAFLPVHPDAEPRRQLEHPADDRPAV